MYHTTDSQKASRQKLKRVSFNFRLFHVAKCQAYVGNLRINGAGNDSATNGTPVPPRITEHKGGNANRVSFHEGFPEIYGDVS